MRTLSISKPCLITAHVLQHCSEQLQATNKYLQIFFWTPSAFNMTATFVPHHLVTKLVLLLLADNVITQVRVTAYHAVKYAESFVISWNK